VDLVVPSRWRPDRRSLDRRARCAAWRFPTTHGEAPPTTPLGMLARRTRNAPAAHRALSGWCPPCDRATQWRWGYHSDPARRRRRVARPRRWSSDDTPRAATEKAKGRVRTRKNEQSSRTARIHDCAWPPAFLANDSVDATRPSSGRSPAAATVAPRAFSRQLSPASSRAQGTRNGACDSRAHDRSGGADPPCSRRCGR